MAWRVTRFEVMRVVRVVCSLVLKDETASEKVLISRAKVGFSFEASFRSTTSECITQALMIVGQVFMSTKTDESAEERREIERLVKLPLF